MNYIGIDIGSTCAKTVVLNEKKELILEFVQPTGWSSVDTAEEIRQKLEFAGINLSNESSHCVATGYGRISVPYADKTVTEITCHALGAVHLFQHPDLTVIDIGGQDTKIIQIEQGFVKDFIMNDKCAAGTGRFLEMMARSLEISIDELGPVSLQSKENIEISSMCSVFAESEVISLIAQNKEIADIAHGIHKAIAGKAMSLLKRVGLNPGYMMTGGVAKNPGVVAVLEEQLGEKLHIYEEPEIVGALGAALYGLEEIL